MSELRGKLSSAELRARVLSLVAFFCVLALAGGVVAAVNALLAHSTPTGTGGPFGAMEYLIAVLVAGLAALGLYRVLRQPEVLRRQVEQRTQELQAALLDAWIQKREVAASKEHVQAVLATTPDAVVAGGADGTITDWNGAAERLFGWTRDEAMGQPLAMLLPEDQNITEVDRHLDDLSEGRTVRVVTPRVRRDGVAFQAELTLKAFRASAGHLGTWVVVARDVTEDMLVTRARTAIGSSLEPTRAVSAFAAVVGEAVGFAAVSLVGLEEMAGHRIVTCGPDGNVLASDARFPLAGTSLVRPLERNTPTLVRGGTECPSLGPSMSWQLAVPVVQRDALVAFMCFGFSWGHPPDQQTIERVWAVVRAVSQDVSNLLLYDRQRQAIDKLRELDQMKSDFLSTLSHELRTPLAAITGFSATLEDHWHRLGVPQQRDFVRRISTKASALDRLIGELLDYSRLERGTLDVDLQPCDMGTELRRELARCADAVADHRLEMDVPDDLHALADPKALGRIIENLLTNAVKFSDPGTTIRVWAWRTPTDVVVAVSDEGAGIPRDEQERIFERFYRAARGDRVVASGTGIGLAIVRQFVEAQGGRVWVESEPGSGSTFHFTLRADTNTTELEIGSGAVEARRLRLGPSDPPSRARGAHAS